jgi:hypothetical protein
MGTDKRPATDAHRSWNTPFGVHLCQSVAKIRVIGVIRGLSFLTLLIAAHELIELDFCSEKSETQL